MNNYRFLDEDLYNFHVFCYLSVIKVNIFLIYLNIKFTNHNNIIFYEFLHLVEEFKSIQDK